VVVVVYHRIDLGCDLRQSVTPQRQDGTFFGCPFGFLVKRRQVEPVGRLSDGDQVDAVVWQTALFRGRYPILYVARLLSLCNLLGTRVGGDYLFEVSG
jgi:hypothetical protein